MHAEVIRPNPQGARGIQPDSDLGTKDVFATRRRDASGIKSEPPQSLKFRVHAFLLPRQLGYVEQPQNWEPALAPFFAVFITMDLLHFGHDGAVGGDGVGAGARPESGMHFAVANHPSRGAQTA